MAPRFSFYSPQEEESQSYLFPQSSYDSAAPDFTSGDSFGTLLSNSLGQSENRINGMTSDRNTLMGERDLIGEPSGGDTGGGLGSLLMGALGGAVGGRGTGLESLYAGRGAAGAGTTYYNNLAADEKEKRATAQKDIDNINSLIRDETNNSQSLTSAGLSATNQMEAQGRGFTHDNARALAEGQIVGSKAYEKKNKDETARQIAVAEAHSRQTQGAMLIPVDEANRRLPAGATPFDPVKWHDGVPLALLNLNARNTSLDKSQQNIDLRWKEDLAREASKLSGDTEFLPWIRTTDEASAKASKELNANSDASITAFRQLQKIYQQNGGTPQNSVEAARVGMLSGRIFTGTRLTSGTGANLTANEMPTVQSFQPDKSIMDQSFIDSLKNRLMDKNSDEFINSAIDIIDRERVTKDLSYNKYHPNKKQVYDYLFQVAPELYGSYKEKFDNARTRWVVTDPSQTMFGQAGTGGGGQGKMTFEELKQKLGGR